MGYLTNSLKENTVVVLIKHLCGKTLWSKVMIEGDR